MNVAIPRRGEREFDFDQEKIFLTNLANAVIVANTTSVSTNASVMAAYNQANLALAQAEVGIAIGEAAYDEANVASANAAIANATAFLRHRDCRGFHGYGCGCQHCRQQRSGLLRWQPDHRECERQFQ